MDKWDQEEWKRFRGTKPHRLIRRWLESRVRWAMELTATQSPNEPTKYASAQGVFLEYRRLSEQFDADLLQFIQQEEEKNGRRDDDD